jgi:phosphopantothenoylcysteine decarboxylase/phosphopantothenate--cysteine ligase
LEKKYKMHTNLQGKRVLLGVTGSISAYKACEIARLFIKAEATVHVVMSEAAQRFVSPLTFEALTRNPVLTEERESWSSELNHIEMGKKCDIFIIAPATANTLNKLSQGIADTLLLQTALAFNKPLLVAPAANTQMLHNHYTTESIERLEANDTIVITPQNKLLACGDKGEGALAEPLEIFYQGAKALLSETYWVNREVVVTGGGTREKIDEVRYLSNFSSGKMAKSVALALYLKGANVCYITTTDTHTLPDDITTKKADTTQSLLMLTTDALKIVKKSDFTTKAPFLFMVAAVSDYTPKDPQQGKLKKSALGQPWLLELTQTPDILKTIDKSGIKTVAFKAEMDATTGLQNATNLLKEKGVDGVCYNLLQNAESFGGDENEITFITPEAKIPLGKSDKLTLAYKILNEASKLTNE